jgi:TrmH family RNA methyltransferase
VTAHRFSPESALGPKSDVVSGARDLLTTRNRKARGQFLIEGPTSVAAVIEAGWAVNVLAVAEHRDVLEDAASQSIRAYLITESAAAALSETVNSQGIFAVCRTPETALEDIDFSDTRPIVVCWGVSDPGNLGTIIRTAAAVNALAVITTTGSADMWNGKVLRSTAGTFTAIDLIGPLAEDVVLELLKSHGVTTLATSGTSRTSVFDPDFQKSLKTPHAWLLGSEAHGLPTHVINDVDAAVYIPMSDSVESLNVATAAAICLYSSQLASSAPHSS